ncbi:hypothetical protein CEXT_151081 [Caerostris extrusa]|uniref:Ig-like domain-containing protein n=1 Tax=Caerostris extrusa TaxID=172846 RepID=A0AAV4TFF7_CAEEX|nr:hypothetical protein CEXT_151081 [Caerostris extrusa]
MKISNRGITFFLENFQEGGLGWRGLPGGGWKGGWNYRGRELPAVADGSVTRTAGRPPGVVSNEDPSNSSCTRIPGGVVSSNGSLIIVAQAQESDAGIYACQVENGIGPGLSKEYWTQDQ